MKKAITMLVLAGLLVLAGCTARQSAENNQADISPGEEQFESSNNSAQEVQQDLSGSRPLSAEETRYVHYARTVAEWYRDGSFHYDAPVYEQMPEDFAMPDLETAQITLEEEDGTHRVAKIVAQDGAYTMSIYINVQPWEGSGEEPDALGVTAVTFTRRQ